MEFPKQITPELRTILGFMSFQLGPVAHLYRDAGHDIPKKAEEEQAYVMFRMLKHWWENEEYWGESFDGEYQEVKSIALKKRETS